MDTVQLLHAPVRSRNAVVRIQQQARQLAKLLGLPRMAQMELGCRAFALGLEAFKEGKKRAVRFDLGDGTLRVGLISSRADAKPDYRLSIAVPKTELSREDFVWVIAQVQILLKTEPFEVIKQQNEEVLLLLHALACRNAPDLARPFDEPSAA